MPRITECKDDVFRINKNRLIAQGVGMSEWISAKDKLPDSWQEVLVFCKWGNSPLIAFHDGLVWTEKCDNIEVIGDACVSTYIHEVGARDFGCQITHWMPLPGRPK